MTGVTFVVEAETRLRDAQALLRRIHLKQEMDGQPRVVLLVAATRHNRQALVEAGDYIGESFPIGTRAALHKLSQGVDPGRDCVVVLGPVVDHGGSPISG